MGLARCGRCPTGVILDSDEDRTCICCGWAPMTEVPLEFEPYPAQERHRRTGPRLHSAKLHEEVTTARSAVREGR